MKQRSIKKKIDQFYQKCMVKYSSYQNGKLLRQFQYDQINNQFVQLLKEIENCNG